ncbi:MAG TPA: protoporphyrinogen oxidase [Bryobacteraceae bacterium]|nr:protoporphyrinogen oxidase [Bryobacteraceae bacterium]
MPSVAIVGGGISGLSTAYYLSKAGISSTLIESRPRLGGVIQTEHIQNCVVEAGPDSFISVKPWAMDLIRELGMEDEVIGSNDHERVTYIRRRGRLVELPDGVQMLVPTKIFPMVTTPLVSWPTKVRMGLEYFRRPETGGRADRSVAEFVEEHYGREAVDYLAEPLLAGIYGGDPAELSVTSVLPRFVEIEKRYGSLTRGVLAERPKADGPRQPLFRTLRKGLGSLVDAVWKAAGQTTIVHGTVNAMERVRNGFRLQLAGDWLSADQVVLACEAHQAARLMPTVDARGAELLASIGYNSSITVALGFERSAVREQMRGFGFLVPKRERRRLLACTWVGNKFPHRVPETLAVLRCFAGGDAAMAETDAALVFAMRQEIREIAAVRAEPLFSEVFRWPRSMAQYTVGHAERMVELDARMASQPGLYLAGNGYHGIGVPDCVRMGKQAAERIANSA